jgi:hypothetical protein
VSYGLVCKTASGEIQFDSRKQMSSYVVTSRGNASSVSVGTNCLVFIKGNSSTVDKVIWGSLSGSVYSFNAFDIVTRTNTSASLDYIVCTPSADISIDAGDDYGLRVYNPDGTVQFDSRSVKDSKHFVITDYQARLTLSGNSADATQPFLASTSSDYVEIKRYSDFDATNAQEYSVFGVRTTGTGGAQAKYEAHARFAITGEFGTFYQIIYATNLYTILTSQLT